MFEINKEENRANNDSNKSEIIGNAQGTPYLLITQVNIDQDTEMETVFPLLFICDFYFVYFAVFCKSPHID